MLKTKDLCFSYNADKTFRFPDLTLGAGASMLVTGASGIGKSTLLRLIAGFIPADSGSILINEQEMVGASANTRDRIRKDHIGMIAQQPRAIQALSVVENLRMVNYLTATSSNAQERTTLLEAIGIGHHADSLPENMSVGEQQRLAIAMATVHRPKLILADEPTSGLDRENCFKVLELMQRQVDEIGASLLLISHDERLFEQIENRVEL